MNNLNISPINQYVKDMQGTIYIGLFNVENRFCYYISALQRLHSSPTLNRLLKNSNLNEAYIRDLLLQPLKIYADINLNNFKQIHDSVANCLSKTIQKFKDTMQSGGQPDHVLICLMLPTIYLLMNNNKTDDIEGILKQIVKELYINPNRLNHLLYSLNRENDFNITIDDNYNRSLKNAHTTISKIFENIGIQDDNKFKFNCSTMSIMFKDETGKTSKYNGHAVNVVYGSSDTANAPKLYVIDDSVGISSFDNFIDRHRNRIGYVEIKDATDETLKLIKSTNGVDVDKRLHRDVINVNSSGMIGGNIEKHEEIVSECNWYPSVEVKDVNVMEGGNTQEIFGEIGAKINVNESKDFEAGNAEPFETFEVGGVEGVDTAKAEGVEGVEPKAEDVTKVVEPKKILNKLNKILICVIVIIIVIIIIILIIRFNIVKKHKLKIESFNKKIETMTNKNEKLKVKARGLVKEITNKKEEMPTPKKEIQEFEIDTNKTKPETKYVNINRPNMTRNLSEKKSIKPTIETYKYIPQLPKPVIHNFKFNLR